MSRPLFPGHRAAATGCKPARGFTLVEVLVAVAILALTLGSFVNGASQYADQAHYLREKTLALWVARNRMAEYRLALRWPDIGGEDGHAQMGGRKWQWQTEVKETQDPTVRRVEISVHAIDPESGQVDDNAVAELTGFLTGQGGAPPTAGPRP